MKINMSISKSSSSNGRNEGCEVLTCSCNNEWQDKEYGKNKRVHNGTTKSWRCTCCKKETNKY